MKRRELLVVFIIGAVVTLCGFVTVMCGAVEGGIVVAVIGLCALAFSFRRLVR